MKVQEVMERVGSTKTKLICAYINDAMTELEELSADNVKRTYYDIIANTRYHELPTDMIKLLGVYRKYDNDGKYVRIPKIQDVLIQEPESSVSTVTSDSDVVII